jgi:multicomponent Na+:H+ antiporter subunit D
MLILLALLFPLLGAVAVALSGDRKLARILITGVAGLATAATVISLMPQVLSGEEPTLRLGQLVPGMEILFRADSAAMVFALSAAVLWVLASVYSFGYVNGAHETHLTRFFSTFALCVAATMGLAFAANLFTFFVFYELLTLATYPLVVHKQTPAAFAAGRRYLMTLLGGGTAVLLAVAAVHHRVPGSTFTPGGVLTDSTSEGFVVLLALLAVIGFGTKAAIMPFQGWLPRAMVAPTPVSALLHAVAVVKAGVFGFVRMFGYVIGPDQLHNLRIDIALLVSTMAAITIVTASIIALRQEQLKRRLAYSTIAHLSFIVLGLSLATPSAWNGALLHLANHAVLKITLFFVAGAIYVTTGCDRVSQLDGIGRRMPLTMTAFAVAAIGLAGLPPMGGFFSKWFLATGTIEAGQPVLAVVVITSGLFTAAYLFPIAFRAFFRAPAEPSTPFSFRTEAAPSMLIPLCLTAMLGLLLGLGDVFHLGELTSEVARQVTQGGR